MREIKFRAWTGEKMRNCSVSVDGRAVMDFGASNSPLMQYTGLKDKNGKEIWEGDVIEHFGDERTKEGQKWQWHQVLWSEKELKWMGSEVDDIWCMDLAHMNPRKIAVIGNIYENPELLTNAK